MTGKARRSGSAVMGKAGSAAIKDRDRIVS